MVHRTSRHSSPNMEATFKKVREFYKQNGYFVQVDGRKAVYQIKDPVAQGQVDTATEKIKVANEDEENVFEVERADFELD
jgi:hypothetical protein